MPKTINPTNGEIIEKYEYIDNHELENKIKLGNKIFKQWKMTPLLERKEKMLKLAELMLERKEELAGLDVLEMGMLYTGAVGDITKTASGIKYVAEHFEEWIADKNFSEGGLEGKKVYEPLGLIYTISPWNFPFNQVFRNATPNILAGNTVISKHASNVPKCARAIEQLFLDAGFSQGVYQNLQISSRESEFIISHDLVRGTNITGGDKAGRAIGALAGKNLKPNILELGGNDPFILLDTSNLDKVVDLAITGRMSSCGQKCNSSKRLIIVEEYYDDFCNKFTQKMSELKIGNPENADTQVGPLAKEEMITDLENLITPSIKAGAKITTGGKRLDREGIFFPPTVIVDVTEDMPLFVEEVFGPVAPIIKAKDYDDAIRLANKSQFGLTACVVTEDKSTFEKACLEIESGNVFWNKIPTSYPFLPYGGIKNSGYGKELGERGIKNFMNEKVVVY